MDHVLSTHLFVNHRLTTASLDRISQAGITAVEIFCARQHLDYQNRAQLDELGHWFRDSKLKLHSLHSPMYNDDVWGKTGPNAVINICETSKPKRIQMTDEIKRALEVAETIPFRYLIQHVGVLAEEYDERKIDAAFASLEEICLFGRQRGVEVLLENIPNRMSTAERLVQFLEMTHLKCGFCFDSGHANIMEGAEAAFLIMRDRIRSTHLHDNDSVNDVHWFPFLKEGGTIDWVRLMELLKSRPGQYPLVLEVKEDNEMGPPLDAVNRIFERLEMF
jgi:sugar phosphate isomerase/epimerase